MSAAHDPTLPLGAAICYCTWRLFDKRKIRNPDGPFFGNSPVFGALGTTLLGLAIGGVVRLDSPVPGPHWSVASGTKVEVCWDIDAQESFCDGYVVRLIMSLRTIV